MSLYSMTVPVMHKMLGNLDRWLEEAVAFAATREMKADTMLTFGLYPDQFNLTRQIQAACDTAKFAAARASGKDAPKHADDETTVEQLRARIASVRSYLEGFSEADFNGVEERIVTFGAMPKGKGALASDYLIHFAVPNFFFHLNMSYAILRSCGVKLGKMKYLGSIPLKDI